MGVASLILSIVAFVVSTYIGIKQVCMEKKEFNLRNRVELYLYVDVLEHINPVNGFKIISPNIIIKNASGGILYLDKYEFNGREYKLNDEVLPSEHFTSAFHYIELPTDSTTHVSLKIYFKDWNAVTWITESYADMINGEWKLTYSPCKKSMREK